MKKPVLAACGLALAVALAACGARTTGGSGDGAPALFGNAQDLARAASAKTGQAKTAKVGYDLTVGSERISAQGVARWDGEKALRLVVGTPPAVETMIITDGSLYVQVPESVRASTTSGKPWGKAPADSDVGRAVAARQSRATDPGETLDRMRQAGTIDRSEQTVLDGQPVTHYWITLDLSKMIQLMQGEVAPASLDKLRGGNVRVPTEIWLNSDLLPVQLTEDQTVMMQALGQTGGDHVGFTVKYTDWGTPVDIQAPPADQVGDLHPPR
ncbi:hypothetical protein ORV05_02905 [Amycolatopsis cynarae]|uniref:LppX_LprAFG lipoprotein n=1 Tax=Amycolatopsis cynarae TaxID=2995223 RepID=A0ABY7B4B8_9PSEU|nr:hypothetical protein [Amycolatopsis sp. HUAS 11-8]WAL66779.1 hypothetical protein ORV05_02905 [Amycolatopsis sp. HUAS 11-8]